MNKRLCMEFKPITEVILGSTPVIVTKEMVARFNQTN